MKTVRIAIHFLSHDTYLNPYLLSTLEHINASVCWLLAITARVDSVVRRESCNDHPILDGDDLDCLILYRVS